MQKKDLNGVEVEINTHEVNNFLQRLVYPIAIIDFETFRVLNSKYKFSFPAQHDFLEKIFSVATLIINKPEHLTVKTLKNKKLKLFSKTQLSDAKDFINFNCFLDYQIIFFRYFINLLIKYHVKSLVFLGSRTEVTLLKNYLAYFFDEPKYKTKINYFFHNEAIFDIYDLWNHDAIINLPQYKTSKKNEVGVNKKNLALIKNNNQYLNILKKVTNPSINNNDYIISNNDIGRIIDQYYSNNCSLLDNFLPLVKQHNEYDVLIGAVILSVLYTLIDKNKNKQNNDKVN